MAGAGAVGAHKNLAVEGLAVELLQRELEHRGVIGGGVRTRVAGPQDAGQALPGAIQVAQQRMVAIAALEVALRQFLIGIGPRQRRVNIQHDLLRARPELPHARARGRDRPAQPLETRSIDRVDHPKRRRVRISGANGLAVGAGVVWVTSRIAGTVTRIDPTTRRADRPIRVGAGAADVVVAEGAVWVANGAASTISRVDPATGRVAAPIRSGAPSVLALAAGDDGLWVARAGGRVEDRVAIVRLDPAKRAVIGPVVAVSGAVPLDLAAGSGSVWATDAGSVLPLGSPRSAAVTRIDARSGPARAGGPLRVGRRPSAIAAGAGGLWVADAIDGTVTPVAVGG